MIPDLSKAVMRNDVSGWRIRWNPAVEEYARQHNVWSGRTIAQTAQALNDAYPDRVLLVEDERLLTVGQLYGAALRVANAFVSRGLRPGDVVSFQLPNWWEASVINLAAAMTGLVVNPILAINRDAEVSHVLRSSGSKMLFIPSEFRGFNYIEMIRRLSETMAMPEIVIVRETEPGFSTFDQIVGNFSPIKDFIPVDPDAVKLLMYTSGTTGRSKGVLHSHNSIQADALRMQASMNLGREDRTFCASPITHVTGYLWVLNGPWFLDVPVVTLDRWSPERAIELIEHHACTLMLGATPFLQDMVRVAQADARTLPSLRYYLCGGASVPPTLILDAARCFPNCIPYRNYGATEVPSITRAPRSRNDLRIAAETDGEIFDAEVKIVDHVSGEVLPDGAEGEMLVREPSMAIGYIEEKDNADAYDTEGYFRTGDLGRIAEGKYIICTGRKKDLIIRAGENLSAVEIESALMRSPKILEAAVVAIPNDRTGEVACAVLVIRPGEMVAFDELAPLISEAGLARQKIPEALLILAELPKTASGKIRKDQLRQIAAVQAERRP